MAAEMQNMLNPSAEGSVYDGLFLSKGLNASIGSLFMTFVRIEQSYYIRATPDSLHTYPESWVEM